MVNNYSQISIQNGREKSLLKRHPWVFSGAISRVNAKAGDIVDILDSDHNFLARGYYNNKATIACRVLTWHQEERIDEAFFIKRFEIALSLRKPFLINTNAYRLVFSEADSIPGLIVDAYDKVIVLQISTLGLEAFREVIVAALVKVLNPIAIYEKSESDSRELEGLKPRSGLLWGELPTKSIEIYEGNAKFLINVPTGQKTGFFLDQRANREAVTHYVSGKTVLNTFCYTGGFSIHAALAGAKSVVSVDSSASALELANENAKLNGVAEKCSFVCEDVFEFLKNSDQNFDRIILDPPALVKTKKDLQAGTNAYRVLHQLALKRLNSHGLLITSSCSGWVDRALFHKIIFWSCEKNSTKLRLIEEMGHTWDHPLSVFFPEGEYLKFAIYQREF